MQCIALDRQLLSVFIILLYYIIYLLSVQLPGITDHPGPATCPRIENEVDSSVILISSGEVKAISVKPVNLEVRRSRFCC